MNYTLVATAYAWIYPTPPSQVGCGTKSIFQQNRSGLNSEFFFSSTGCLTKAKEPCLPYYLKIGKVRTDGFLPFLEALVQNEMQGDSSRIWTQVTNSLSHNNHYT